ncbi:MAG: hypothetical protein LBU31_00125 [Coriobacteriales bacterium]|jgi:hypothetical protein|nr:hypothetical protein [Coriobacteriales bacterium]
MSVEQIILEVDGERVAIEAILEDEDIVAADTATWSSTFYDSQGNVITPLSITFSCTGSGANRRFVVGSTPSVTYQTSNANYSSVNVVVIISGSNRMDVYIQYTKRSNGASGSIIGYLSFNSSGYPVWH